MKVLIDIGHPAHVHLFKCFAAELKNKGHQVLFTLRNKEFSEKLLQHEGVDYISYGSSVKGMLKKLLAVFPQEFRLWRIIKKFTPDITFSHGSFYLSHVCWFQGITNITLEDTGNMEQISLYKPFTNIILTPACYKKNHGKKQVRYPGYHELFYLHSNRFTPDKNLLTDHGVVFDKPIVLIRFINWGASHDVGHQGLSLKNKMAIVHQLKNHATVYISSEDPLPQQLAAFRVPTPPFLIHHLMAFASLVFGESATMASEAAMLGVPSIYIDNNGRDYTDELEKQHQMVFTFKENEKDQREAVKKSIEILTGNEKKQFQKHRIDIMKQNIDGTAFLLWLTEEYYKTEKKDRKKTTLINFGQFIKPA